MRHIYQCPLRWSDMDAFGHVNNVVHLRYLEEARIDFMFRLAREAQASAGASGEAAAVGAVTDGSAADSHGSAADSSVAAAAAAPVDRTAADAAEAPFTGGSVVARHEIDYLRPLVHRHHPVTVETWVTKLGAASATLAYEIKDPDTVYVRAQTVVVPYNLKEERPRRLTEAEKTFLEGYFDDSATASGIR